MSDTPTSSLTNVAAETKTDPWFNLRRYTAARIALGRTGGSLPTRELLSFNQDHAAARDAVHSPLNAEILTEELRTIFPNVLTLSSAASNRPTYLQRPDLGRSLSSDSRQILEDLAASSRTAHNTAEGHDLAIIVSDGLSALAAHRQAVPLLSALLPKLVAAHWSIAPLCVVRHARVALEDEVGSLLHARIALILLGERPGLIAPDSLGAYFVYGPKIGNSDAGRNCISNIRPEGLRPNAAADKLFSLLTASHQLQLSGIALKEEPVVPKLDT